MKGLFGLKIRYDNVNIIDSDFNKFEDLEKSMKEIKKKFKGDF